MSNGEYPTTPPPPPPAGTPQGYAPPPPAAPKKSGLPALAWIGIGCGAIVLIGVIAFSLLVGWGVHKAKGFAEKADKDPSYAAMKVAEIAIKANPDYELVSADEDAHTFTVRETKTGKETTIDLADIQNGKLGIKSGDQEMTVGAESDDNGGGALTVRDKDGKTRFRMGTGGGEDIPGWVPRYEGAKIAGTGVSNTDEGTSGGFTFTTDDALDDVVSFYKKALADAGMKITGNNTFSNEGSRGATLTAGEESAGRTVQVFIGSTPGKGTQGTVTFAEKKTQ